MSRMMGLPMVLPIVISPAGLGRSAPGSAVAETRRQSFIEKMWWNQPKKVEELQLSAPQRSAMDAHLVSFLEQGRNRQQSQREALDALVEALARNDRDVARDRGERVAAAMSEPVGRQVEMMIEVVAVLTAEQREELVSRYPKMLSRLWIRSANPRLTSTGRESGGPRH